MVCVLLFLLTGVKYELLYPRIPQPTNCGAWVGEGSMLLIGMSRHGSVGHMCAGVIVNHGRYQRLDLGTYPQSKDIVDGMGRHAKRGTLNQIIALDGL